MPALRAGVLNIHFTVIFTVLCTALREGVPLFTELCAALRAGVLNRSLLLLFLLNYVLLSGQKYSMFILLLFLVYYACSHGRSTPFY